jgi:hypothetical protein
MEVHALSSQATWEAEIGRIAIQASLGKRKKKKKKPVSEILSQNNQSKKGYGLSDSFCPASMKL